MIIIVSCKNEIISSVSVDFFLISPRGGGGGGDRPLHPPLGTRLGGRSTKPLFFRKLSFFFKINDFESSLIVLKPACKILKSLKNGNLVLQLAKICLLSTGSFP